MLRLQAGQVQFRGIYQKLVGGLQDVEATEGKNREPVQIGKQIYKCQGQEIEIHSQRSE